MTNLQQYEQSVLQRSMYWKYQMQDYSDEVVNRISNLVSNLRTDLSKRLENEAQDYIDMSWTNQNRTALALYLDEVVAGTQAEVSNLVNSSTLIAGEQSLAMYNNILSVDGFAKGIATVGFTSEQYKTWFDTDILQGVDSTNWINRTFTAGVKTQLYDTIITAGLEGKGTKATVNRLMQSALDSGIELTERENIGIARTYIQSANVGAMKEVYYSNADLINEYEYTAILDLTTCVLCAWNDGKRYKTLEESPRLPKHWNCRCLLLPKIKSWRSLGLNIDDLEEAQRNWVVREKGSIGAGGQRKILESGTTTANFRDWIQTKSVKDMSASMGIVRARLLDKGLIDFEDIVKQDGLTRTTLKDLGFDLRGNKL